MVKYGQDDLVDFVRAFRGLTDNSPLRWQERLYARMRAGDIPDICDLPTGLGKTSIIPIWLLAFASQVAAGVQDLLPRRLIYIVNRRTVVDQATAVTEMLRKRLLGLEPVSPEANPALGSVRQALGRVRAFDDGPLLAISTLRGELADNEEWKADPARAAIVVGTIDMIGSRLLFSSYGDGPYGRAHHAGLAGQDSLIVHDEAHLTPAFGQMLHFVAREQKRGEEPRPIRVTELSATTQRAHGTVLTLEPQDEKDVLVRQRLDARKQLKVHLIEESKIVDVIAGLASAHESIPSKVLLYVRAPADAQKLAASLEKRLGRDARGRIALLTGTIRGHERDDLVNANPVYLAFLDGQARPERTIYLVSTSAGEVGIDLDADHLLCDMTTLDSMIQRLGRVNRRGGDGRSAEVDVVAASEESSKSPDPRRVSTLAILRSLPSSGGERRDASPRALRAMMASLTDEGKEAAWSAQSDALSMSDILLDSWALTSIRQGLPGRPEVAAYLHGLTNDPPETYVAWRSEVALLVQADAGRQQLTGWFRSCRIKAGERLRARTVSVKQNLEALLKAHRRKNGSIDFSTFVLDERGEVEQALLSQVVTEQFDLRYRTVVLPVEAGGLSPYGILDSASLEPVLDVGDQPGVRERTIETESRPLISSLTEKYRIVLHGSSEDGEEGEGKYLVLLVGREQSALDHPETTAACQSLVAHSQQIGECAEQVVRALGFEQSLSDALVIAARRHDHGKAHPVWQRFACNRDAEHPLAKSTRYLHGRALAGYRHELGSLLESVRDPSLLQHPERDLILHLISSHHGWARPHFDPRAFDSRFTTAENEYETHEVMRRFARLQRRFGRWGLAWLESLLRCADIAASRAAVEHTNEEKTAS